MTSGTGYQPGSPLALALPSFVMPNPRHTLIRCLGLCDGRLSVAGSRERPAALLVEHTDSRLRSLAVGAAEQVERHPAAVAAQTRDLLDWC